MAHSLGGLITRYAIAILHTPQHDHNEDVILLEELESRGHIHAHREQAKIAGLEAVNYITLASPHLGLRGKSQVRQDHFGSLNRVP